MYIDIRNDSSSIQFLSVNDYRMEGKPTKEMEAASQAQLFVTTDDIKAIFEAYDCKVLTKHMTEKGKRSIPLGIHQDGSPLAASARAVRQHQAATGTTE